MYTCTTYVHTPTRSLPCTHIVSLTLSVHIHTHSHAHAEVPLPTFTMHALPSVWMYALTNAHADTHGELACTHTGIPLHGVHTLAGLGEDRDLSAEAITGWEVTACELVEG